ncbi:hypothetical protein BAE44_0011857 [Dichanthelium oligosanthes]|uniref:Retrovirus-related Pol polyprotein from transposon TNT 1-94-like beta-barrel domain-containing protein n=1 Tax=Dichanthelium oligosanthes TaxID=888268 RepID=A0A1E5VPY4_9POAL|nr:hypothetical protein BAE44_0011857 [Dichanthelium oligosanthes]
MMAEGQQDEPLLRAPKAADPGEAGGFSWLTALGFAFLTFNSGMAIWRSSDDSAAVAFVAVSYMFLVVLFCCLRWFERAPPGSTTRGRLKVAVWLLTTLLTAAFSYKVAAIMPAAARILVWLMAVATILGGFCAFFLHKFKKGKTVALLAAFGGAGSRIIADTGATMHAVGDRTLLQGLQLYAIPKVVTLPNGTAQSVLGIGHLKSETFSVPNVSLVEGFQKSLISISQLDRFHGMHSCFGKGKAEIMLHDGTVVGGAFLDESDGMYVLRFLKVPITS